MLIAASLAGMCFCNTMTGATHATAHALGALYGIPHGLANAIMLPVVMDANVEACPERFMVIADAMGIDVHGKTPEAAAMEAVQAVRDLKREIGLTESLKQFKVPDDPDKLAALVESRLAMDRSPTTRDISKRRISLICLSRLCNDSSKCHHSCKRSSQWNTGRTKMSR